MLLVAGGGGQHSAAFAVLGAHVTVTDLSEDQLAQDQAVAAHHGLVIDTLQADMRDLSALPPESFDVVWQGYSVNFVPDVAPVFAEIARVITWGGLYRFQSANPFFHGMTEQDWNGSGYVIRHPYEDGTKLTREDPDWAYQLEGHGHSPIPPAREYRHSLATIVNALSAHGFGVERLLDQPRPRPGDPVSEPGTWRHFISVCPQYLTFWSRFRPDVTALPGG